MDTHSNSATKAPPLGTTHAARTAHKRPPRTTHPIRLVALDLDGTLLTSRKTISPLTHTAVKAAVARGIKVVLATARPPRSVRAYYEALKLDTPTVNYNGALIWDESRRKAVEHVPLDVKVAREVITFGRKFHPELLVSVEILDKWYTDHFSDVPEFLTETAKYFAPDFVGPLDAFMRVPITKLMLMGNPKIIATLEKSIVAKFGKTVAQTRSDAHMLQLMSPDTSKAGALEKVAAAFGIPAAHCMAIGDAPNDTHMLQWAGLAVVPENAWPDIKKFAHAVVPSNDKDGIAIAFQKFVLK